MKPRKRGPPQHPPGSPQGERRTARVPDAQNHFLINRFGMLYDEITASSLVKIDVDGNKVEPTDDEVNSGGFAIPSTIHMARPDINCVIHTHTVAGCAVSMQKGGLLPLNQHALQVIGDVPTTTTRAPGEAWRNASGSLPISPTSTSWYCAITACSSSGAVCGS